MESQCYNRGKIYFSSLCSWGQVWSSCWTSCIAESKKKKSAEVWTLSADWSKTTLGTCESRAKNECNAKPVQTSDKSLKILVAWPGPRWKRKGEGPWGHCRSESKVKWLSQRMRNSKAMAAGCQTSTGQAGHSAKQLNILSTQHKHLDCEEVIEWLWLHIKIWQGCGCTVALQRTPRKYWELAWQWRPRTRLYSSDSVCSVATGRIFSPTELPARANKNMGCSDQPKFQINHT